MSSSPPSAHPPGSAREMLRVAYPLVISMASFTLMQFADRVFLARYSSAAIQASLPAGILSFTFIGFFHALAGYAGAFVAQYHGAGDRYGCSRATAQGLWLALASWPLILALIPAGNWILTTAGHEAAVLAEERIYFVILMQGGVAVALVSALSAFFTGRGDTRTAMFASVCGNVVNIVLDYAMIFGYWGFPRMGIAGAAWATVAGSVVTIVILAALYLGPGLANTYDTRRLLRLEGVLLARIVRFGAPAAVHLVLDIGAFALFVLMTGRLGGLALAASNIALSINNIAFQPLFAIHMAASILVGQYQGRGESATAERAGWSALRIGWIYMAAVAVTFALFPGAYIALFTGPNTGIGQEELLPVARWLLLMMAAWGMFDAINIILSGALRGAGDTRFSMYYAVALAWGLWIPGEVALLWWIERLRREDAMPEWMFGGIVPLWGWMTLFVLVLAAGFLLRFRSGRWKSIQLIEPVPLLLPPRTGADAMTAAE